MKIPHDERQHYDAAVQANLEADRPPAQAQEIDPEQVRYLKLVSRQALHVLQDAPDLLTHLVRAACVGAPPGTASASEIALWRTGFEDCIATIHTAADWKGGEDG